MCVIAVDVDQTVVDSAEHWLNWLQTCTGHKVEQENLPYNLSTLFPEEPYIDFMEFWKHERLYDGMTPIAGAQEALQYLHEQGFDIVFASYCKGNHGHSKFDFLEKYFPYMKGVLWTREKQHVACDFFIDDRNEFINLMPPSVDCIRFETRFGQTVEPRREFISAYSWGDIPEIISARSEMC